MSAAADHVVASKALSQILRHKAVSLGLSLRPDGFVPLAEVLRLQRLSKFGLDLDKVRAIVDSNAKKRFALPMARIMVHQPWGGVQGQASDISIQAKEILRMREMLNGILAHHTGKPLEAIEKDTDRDFFMSAEEAAKYGLVDEVIKSRKVGKS